MDTDCNYIAISAEWLEAIVWPDQRAEFEEKKKEWLVWDKWSGHMPGLFTLEREGSRMIALCSKYYFIDEQDSKKKEPQHKGHVEEAESQDLAECQGGPGWHH